MDVTADKCKVATLELKRIKWTTFEMMKARSSWGQQGLESQHT